MACNCNGTDQLSCLKVTSLNYKFPPDDHLESIYYDPGNYGGTHNQIVCYQNQIGKAKALLQRWADANGKQHSDLDTLNLLCEIFDIKAT